MLFPWRLRERLFDRRPSVEVPALVGGADDHESRHWRCLGPTCPTRRLSRRRQWPYSSDSLIVGQELANSPSCGLPSSFGKADDLSRCWQFFLLAQPDAAEAPLIDCQSIEPKVKATAAPCPNFAGFTTLEAAENWLENPFLGYHFEAQF
ncbi:hypothetical protein L484_026724 [Morus notabilis]|uniref:Uncharacterized protein n=1 Tax=Morus notabilis TaxID=981085 RepID=W9SD38_9ROSA|nr:hypothetical protein L484_026724 [Morus notabilis]